ncbi:hypothetical protein HOLleu_22035 [Holothuria leucospilota]|uniref:CIDE-N domain-containing protein n=1 Tax=Holothuria leucospilota TaxID=206669 RepID=A0A9Q1H780_HOLLE|nr:hypothetical protein HOLleu_22035 [Holothuria leucospilota]
MPLIRLFRNEIRKIVFFNQYKQLVAIAKRKFAIDDEEEVTLMDKNGAEVDEDALIPLVEVDPRIELMVLKAGEKWASPGAVP